MSARSSQQDEAGFRLRLPATPAAPAVFRRSLRDWLKSRYLPPADIFDVVLACSESLALVIEDPPRPVALVVEVSAELDENRLVVRTRDYGLWREPHAREDEPLALSLMRALMDSVELERHPDGQTVTLVRTVPGAAGGGTALLSDSESERFTESLPTSCTEGASVRIFREEIPLQAQIGQQKSEVKNEEASCDPDCFGIYRSRRRQWCFRGSVEPHRPA